MDENKQEILDLLLSALQKTRYLCYLKCMTYDEPTGVVDVEFITGFHKFINCECDSGIAMIRDVLQALW